MTFVEAIKSCMSKYARFSGRASRSEYWWFVLFIVLTSTVLGIIDNNIFGVDPVTQTSNGVFGPLFSLVTLLPVLSVGWRRMHDSGRPGWYLLLPMLVTLSTFFFLMIGVMSFATLQNIGADPEMLRGPAEFLGLTGMVTAVILQLALVVLLLWWLTRPSDAGINAFGPPPTTG
ncbi:MAG: hypothetical protein COC12_14230 [Rhodobacteraceae bacterium]|nr:MAG: hypothetical protein COC12_14230 [Paracoccaceae bacterium]